MAQAEGLLKKNPYDVLGVPSDCPQSAITKVSGPPTPPPPASVSRKRPALRLGAHGHRTRLVHKRRAAELSDAQPCHFATRAHSRSVWRHMLPWLASQASSAPVFRLPLHCLRPCSHRSVTVLRRARVHSQTGANRTSVDSPRCWAVQDMFSLMQAFRRHATGHCKQAYRKRVLETHPDKAPVKSAANADAFAEVQAAYALIRDEDVRRQFDLQMRIGRYGPGNAATATRYTTRSACGTRFDAHLISAADARRVFARLLNSGNTRVN